MSGSEAVPGLTCDEVREVAGAFVLGALEPIDAAAVRDHLASCSDAHEEIAELGGVLPALNQSVPIVEPPAGLKARLMAAAAADLEERGRASGSAAEAPRPIDAVRASVATPIAFPVASERAARRARTSLRTWALGIAAVLAIVALGGWNLRIQGQLNAANSYAQSVAAVLVVAAEPDSLTAVLTADGGAGSGLAAVDATGQVTMAMQDLTPTSGSGVYEAWVIGGDGTPVPLGSFTVGATGTASFVANGLPTSSGIVLAVTKEPGPGATTPTMPIISKGRATAAG